MSKNNKINYARYKASVDRAETRRAWLNDKSIKGVLKRAASEVVDIVLIQPGASKARNALIFGAPKKELEHNAAYFKHRTDAVKLDAIHDASSIGLDLPESGLPETVTNVRSIESQHPGDHTAG